MDFGKVLGRAWQITWRWKVLWILGFLASLGSGGGGGGGGSSSYSYDGRSYDLGPWIDDKFWPEIWAAIGGLILGLLCLGLLIAIALWVVSIIARGGLVAGVQQVEDEGTTTFGQAWRVGASRFWTLLGIAVLAALPMFILVGILLVTLVLGILFGVALIDVSEGAGVAGILSAVLCGGVFCCGLILVAIVLEQIRIYAERAAILEELGWLDAFKRGWEVLKDNLAPTIILWLIFFGLGLVIAAVIVVGLMVVGVPSALFFGSIDPGLWMVAPLCCGGLLALIAFALIGSVVETFTSATWTLAYRELTGLAAPPEAELLFED
jgi:hypothetical protein